MTDLLQQGIAAARAGQRAEARALLMSVVETDERNEQAWLWLAGVVDDPDDVRTCLQNVLDLNPANQHAKQGLAWIESRNGSSASSESAAAPAAPASSAAAAAPTRSEPAALPQPVSEPVVPASNTGPTTNLASVVAPAPPARPVAAASAAAPDTLPAERPEHPCPYCGVPTVLSQHACTQCKGDLMVRTAARTTSSVPLKILGGLWVANGVFSIIGSLLGAVGALLIFQQMQSMAVSINPKASVPFPTIILIPIVIGLLFGFGIIKVARALMRRERWAYYIIIALSALGFIVTLINVAQVGTMLRELVTPGAVLLPASQQSMVTRIVAVAGAAAFCTLAFQALYLALIGLCYRDFFGPMVRFIQSSSPPSTFSTTTTASPTRTVACGIWLRRSGRRRSKSSRSIPIICSRLAWPTPSLNAYILAQSHSMPVHTTTCSQEKLSFILWPPISNRSTCSDAPACCSELFSCGVRKPCLRGSGRMAAALRGS